MDSPITLLPTVGPREDHLGCLLSGLTLAEAAVDDFLSHLNMRHGCCLDVLLLGHLCPSERSPALTTMKLEWAMGTR